MVVIVASVAVHLIVRCCRRRQKRQNQIYGDRRDSTDTLDDMPEDEHERKPSETGERRRWWDWRTEDEDYLPLQEREREERQREEQER